MKHFYVVSGNEFGIDIYSKKNFSDQLQAAEYFEKTKTDDFGCMIVFVNEYGEEEILESYYDE